MVVIMINLVCYYHQKTEYIGEHMLLFFYLKRELIMKISENIYIDWYGFDRVVSTDTSELGKIVRRINNIRGLNSTVDAKLYLVDTLLRVINHKLLILVKEFPQALAFEVQPCLDNFGELEINGNFFDLDEEEIDTFSNHYDIEIADKCITNIYCIFKKFFQIPFDMFTNPFNTLTVIDTVTKRRFDVWVRIGSIILGTPVEKLEHVSDRVIRDNIFERVFNKSYKNKDIELKDRLTKQLQNSNFGKLIDYVDTDIEITKQVINNIYGYKKEENNMPPKSYYKDMFTEPSQAVKDESRHKLIQSMEILLGIIDVKFNDPATIVFWDDGTKTVVKCQEGDTFDPEKGLAMAIVKKHCGNEGYFNRIFKKWCPEPEEEKSEDESLASYNNIIGSIKNLANALKADNSEDNVETKEFTKANDGYDDITWLTRRSYDRA